jgi:DNA invertase Pin-like site-specific DNA recombinase
MPTSLVRHHIGHFCPNVKTAFLWLFGIMAVVAQAERKMISARTRAALQAAKARGVKLGGVRHRQDGSIVKLDLDSIAAGRTARTAKSAARAIDLAPIIADLKATGAVSLRQIAANLNERGIPCARGGQWSTVQVQRAIDRAGRIA